jgi:hypothetical protein
MLFFAPWHAIPSRSKIIPSNHSGVPPRERLEFGWRSLKGLNTLISARVGRRLRATLTPAARAVSEPDESKGDSRIG